MTDRWNMGTVALGLGGFALILVSSLFAAAAGTDGMTAMVCLPMWVGGLVLGVLAIQRFKDGRTFAGVKGVVAGLAVLAVVSVVWSYGKSEKAAQELQAKIRAADAQKR